MSHSTSKILSALGLKNPEEAKNIFDNIAEDHLIESQVAELELTSDLAFRELLSNILGPDSKPNALTPLES